MTKEIKYIRSICESLEIPAGKLTDEYLFTLVGMNYFFFGGNMGAKDIQDGFVDGTNDGGIDFIYSNNDTLYLIQGKSQEVLSLEDLHNIFNKIHNTVNQFDKGDYSKYNSALKSIYLNSLDSLPDNANISLILFTNANINSDTEKKFYKEIDESHLKDYDIKIYDGKSITMKSNMDQMEKEFVSSDAIKIEKAKEHLKYGDDGVIVNILASSLKDIYDKHHGKGLFNYNLREHISQKNVDSGIDNTILKEREYFWYYNNGITFACEDFYIDGNKVRLTNFSIINGAQTTTKIGKSPYVSAKRDFCLVCKIVRSPRSLRDDFDFMTKISEASNSQKPIKLRDLRANKPEQKVLQIESSKSKFPLAIEIKRGVRPKNYNKVVKWQKVKNEYIGQLILSMILQKPGTARSAKNSIFGSEKIYNQIFRRNHDYVTLHDIVKLGSYFDDFKVEYTKKTSNIDHIAIARNGKFVILAIVAYMIKRGRGIVENSYDENIHADNLNGTIIQNYKDDNFDKILYELFRFLIKTLGDIYKAKVNELKLTSYSNFFKTDKTYRVHILNQIDERIYQDEFDSDRIEKYMKIFDRCVNHLGKK